MLTVTDVSTTCAVVIFRVKVSCITVDTISFSYFFFFFYALYKLTCDPASSFLFSLEGEKKRFLFSLEGYVVNTPFFIQYQTQIHSIGQFFTGSFAVHLRDHLRSRIICCLFWGSFAVLYSTDVLLLIKSISFMTLSLSSPVVKLKYG